MCPNSDRYFCPGTSSWGQRASKNLKVREQEAHVLRHVLHECRIAAFSTVHPGDAATRAHELFDVKPGVGCGYYYDALVETPAQIS